jgi:outer membrane protein assembly factor BamB
MMRSILRRGGPAVTVMLLAVALAACNGGSKGKGKVRRTPTVGERIPILSFETRAEAETELKDLTIILPGPDRNAEWAQPGGSLAKAGGHLALAETPRQIWEASIGKGSSATARLNAAPVVAGGRVFTMDIAGQVRALDAGTGRMLWTQQIRLKKKNDHAAFGGGVSVADGRVYATSGYGIAAAYDAATGKPLWERSLGEPLRGAPTAVSNRLFVMTQDNQLFALNPATGETAWNITGTVEPAAILGAGAPAVALETVVVGFSSGELNALRTENGRTVWQDQLSRTGRSTAMAALADIDGSPVIDRGRVYAIGHGGRMVALEFATGQRVWERNFAGTSTPWPAGEFIYLVTVEGEVVCITRAEGKVRWVQRLPQYRKPKKKKDPLVWEGPVLAGETLWVTGSSRQLLGINPYDGKTRLTLKLPAATYLAPVVADGTMYVLSDNGRLTAWR